MPTRLANLLIRKKLGQPNLYEPNQNITTNVFRTKNLYTITTLHILTKQPCAEFQQQM